MNPLALRAARAAGERVFLNLCSAGLIIDAQAFRLTRACAIVAELEANGLPWPKTAMDRGTLEHLFNQRFHECQCGWTLQ